MKPTLLFNDKYIGKAKEMIIRSKNMIFGVMTALVLTATVFAGTTHTEGGPVSDAGDGTAANGSSFRVFRADDPSKIITGTVGSFVSGAWIDDVGAQLDATVARPNGWLVGDDHMCIIDKETNGGTASHKGYYAVINKDLTSNDPDEFGTCTLRAIPIPVGTGGNNQASLSWTAATEDPGTPNRTNITGYRILRSTSQTGPYTFLATVEGSTSYTDSTAVNGTTYYYVIQLVYRNTGTALTSAYYSANSNAVTPAAPTTPTLISASPSGGYRGDTLNVVITGSNTNFVNGVSAANFGSNITVNSTTVTDSTHLTANISINTSAATGARNVTVVTGGETATGTNLFTVNAPSISMSPSSGAQGWTGNINVTGTGSHFINGTTTAVFSGAGITVNSVTVASSTSATVNITIDPAAATGARTITVSTSLGALGTEAVTGSFSVTSGSASGIVIDDYEYYADKDPRGMMDYYYESGSGADEVTIPTVANSTATVHESVRSMEITYPGAVGTQWGGYWGGGLTAEVKDLTPYTGVSLWVKGDGTANTISINLLEADVSGVPQETYASTSVTLTDTNWHEVEIPFSAFVRDPYGNQLEGTFSKIIKGYTILYRGTNASAVKHYVDYIVAKNVSVSATPTVTGVVPDTGPNNTTTDVVITGTNFGGVTAVQIGTWPVSSFTVNSATEISAVIPAGLPVGPFHVTVTSPYGTSAQTPADIFTVTDGTTPATPPTVDGVIPNTGVNTSTTPVVITGTGFTGVTAVRIGTWPVTSFTVNGSTEISAVIPAGLPAGSYHVTVTTPNGTSAQTPADIFTVTEPGGPVTDDTPPVISDVRFDGKPVLDGDFVSRTPVITALLTDDVAIDPSTIRVGLVNVYDIGSVPAVTFDPATGRMELVITSPLPYGATVFTINVSDTSGNTAEFRITLNGNDGNVFNYPNPFDPINGTTKIAFNLRDNAEVTIYLFDMTGRIVVRRSVNATVGFNEYEWDGRDDYGVIASNGVYMLRLVSGNRLIGKTKVWVIKR